MSASATVNLKVSVNDMALILAALEAHARSRFEDGRDRALLSSERRNAVIEAERARDLAQELKS